MGCAGARLEVGRVVGLEVEGVVVRFGSESHNRLLVTERESVPVAFGVGGGLFLAVLIAGSLSSVVGGSAILNPAVAFSLQAFTLKGQNVLFAIATYVGAALLGGILGFALDSLIQETSKEEK